MVLYNSASRSRNVASILNQDQGGGSKKAGLVPMAAPNMSWGRGVHGMTRNANTRHDYSTKYLDMTFGTVRQGLRIFPGTGAPANRQTKVPTQSRPIGTSVSIRSFAMF